MATKTSEQTLQSLGVNLVASQTVFEQMQQASQIQPNEFFYHLLLLPLLLMELEIFMILVFREY